MKISTLHPVTMEILGFPKSRTVFCVYEATHGDSWKGYVAARAGWRGEKPFPAKPEVSFSAAIENLRHKVCDSSQ